MSLASDAPLGDRGQLEIAEARTLVYSFLMNGKSTDWLNHALRGTTRIYGKGADLRVRDYMRKIWKDELCK